MQGVNSLVSSFISSTKVLVKQCMILPGGTARKIEWGCGKRVLQLSCAV